MSGGLITLSRRSSVHLFLQNCNASLVCFQESKLAVVDNVIVGQTLGPAFDGFDFLPTEGTRGGILLAWKSDRLLVSTEHKGEFSMSIRVTSLADGKEWLVTSVYGPQDNADKIRFLEEIVEIGRDVQLPWILNGDFNLVHSEEERSTHRINRRLAKKFKHTINTLGLHDMPLVGRRFTWSNDQEHTVIDRLDRVLFNNAWEEIYPISDPFPLSSSISDHCPLLLTCSSVRPKARCFRFENFWVKLPGFMDVVKAAWKEEVSANDPMVILQRMAKALRSWGQRKQSFMIFQFQIANELILRFDSSQEHRPLSEEERRLKAFLKGKCLALASLERVRLCQRAKVRDLQEGDANTKYFHIKANGHRRKHQIPFLRNGQRTVSALEDKLELVRDFCSGLMGTPARLEASLKLDQLNIHCLSPDLANGLEATGTDTEAKQVIMEMLSDRALGTYGFSGLFYKVCWDVIGKDFMAVMHELHRSNFASFGRLNSSIITLLPKKECSLQVADFRPINLIHGVANFFAKVLAVHLAPLLPTLISQVQSAFTSRRSIHENFNFVRSAARLLHRKKSPTVLMKLDISKVFDTLSWEFIILILIRRGFGKRWCSWVCGLLRTASPSVLVNGETCEPFSLGCGVRQGDPLSLALFILAMDTLQAMLHWAI